MSNTFTDLSTVRNIRNRSKICVTYIDITWDAPSITCGDVSYEMILSQSHSKGDAIKFLTSFTALVNSRMLRIAGLNNSLPDITITVTTIDRVGQRNGSVFSVQLPKSLGKCCM